MSDETTRLKLPQLVSMQEMNNLTWNEALAQLDALVDLVLLAQSVNTPPPNPADGDAYLIGGAPTGAWTGYAYKIASCLDGGWRFYTPYNGLRAFVAASGAVIVYMNGAWTAVGSTDFATRSGAETLTNKTLGATQLPGRSLIDTAGNIVLNNTGAAPALAASSQTGLRLVGDATHTRVLSIEGYGSNSGNFAVGFARGTPDNPLPVQAGDTIYYGGCSGYDGVSMATIAAFRAHAQENLSATAHGAYFVLEAAATGSVVRQEIVRIDGNGFLRVAGYLTLRAYLVATLPSGVAPYSRAFVTDSTLGHAAGLGMVPVGGGTNRVPVYTVDGTSWIIG